MRFQTLFAALALSADPALALGGDAGGKQDFKTKMTLLIVDLDDFSTNFRPFLRYLEAVMNRPKRGMSGSIYRGGYF